MAVLLVACGGGGGAGTTLAPAPLPASEGLNDAVSYSSAADGALAAPEERAAVVQGHMALAGKQLDYTATSGHLTALDARSGQPVASFFYVAYTAGTLGAARRPLTFFYNGGPGSSSMWLHLGAFGPKRVVTGIPAAEIPLPVQLVDNQETLLDYTDLVYVDAIGTGFSQAVAPNQNQDFWGVDRDAAAFRDFVRRYVAVNQRQVSPKFLFGESYGAPRTAVLANLLETAGMALDGIVLHSAIMNYNSNCGVFAPGSVSCEGYFPSFAATGAYHGVSVPVPPDLVAYVQQARVVGAGAYRNAIGAWLLDRSVPADSVQVQLAALTGMAQQLWRDTPDFGPNVFQAGLLPARLIGRYDARVVAAKGSALAADNDPSLTVVSAAFSTTIRSYLQGELKYTARSSYVTNNNIVERWDFRHDGKAVPDTIPDLAAAMLQNPALKVLALGGYHDLATPFYQTEMDLARLDAGSAVRIINYGSGHMIYLDDVARRAQKSDLAAFLHSESVAK